MIQIPNVRVQNIRVVKFDDDSGVDVKFRVHKIAGNTHENIVLCRVDKNSARTNSQHCVWKISPQATLWKNAYMLTWQSTKTLYILLFAIVGKIMDSESVHYVQK